MSDKAMTIRDGADLVSAELLEQVIINGDLAQLSPEDRLTYYRRVCESLDLNPLTKPFAYIKTRDGKLILYALRGATDQLRQRRGISIDIVRRETIEKVHIVTARATDQSGRTDTSTGAVALFGKYGDFSGEDLANAFMKAETKAKRRVTLSLVGLGWLDESEIETVPMAQPVMVDQETGQIMNDKQQPSPETPTRPYSPETLRRAFAQKLADDAGEYPSDGLRGMAVGALNALFEIAGIERGEAVQLRHILTEYLLGKPSSMPTDDQLGWTGAECRVLLKWAQTEDETGKVPHQMAVREAKQIIETLDAAEKYAQEQAMQDQAAMMGVE